MQLPRRRSQLMRQAVDAAEPRPLPHEGRGAARARPPCPLANSWLARCSGTPLPCNATHVAQAQALCSQRCELLL
eukprot:7203959-Alexandrium_andersonii.AAC.1